MTVKSEPTRLGVEQLWADVDWVLQVRLDIPDRTETLARGTRLLAVLPQLVGRLTDTQRATHRALLLKCKTVLISAEAPRTPSELAWHTQDLARIVKSLAKITGLQR